MLNYLTLNYYWHSFSPHFCDPSLIALCKIARKRLRLAQTISSSKIEDEDTVAIIAEPQIDIYFCQ